MCGMLLIMRIWVFIFNSRNWIWSRQWWLKTIKDYDLNTSTVLVSNRPYGQWLKNHHCLLHTHTHTWWTSKSRISGGYMKSTSKQYQYAILNKLQQPAAARHPKSYDYYFCWVISFDSSPCQEGQSKVNTHRWSDRHNYECRGSAIFVLLLWIFFSSSFHHVMLSNRLINDDNNEVEY